MTDLPPVLYVHVYILPWPEAPYLLAFLRFLAAIYLRPLGFPS